MPNRVSMLAMAPLFAALVACAPVTPPSPRTGGEVPKPVIDRTVVLVARAEVNTLAAKALAGNAFGAGGVVAPFNATLEGNDVNGVPIPELAVALPALRTDSWQIFPDGRMETRYELKPSLTWHDGVPLTARDFVFAWNVYATPAFGLASSGALAVMQEIVAPDDRTIVIRWRAPYPDAGALTRNGLPPLPDHLLGQPFRESDPATFVNHSFWIQDYVGLGPYKVARWEPGAFIEGTAFPGYVLGKPKIERMRIAFMGDVNTITANMLSGDVQFAWNYALGLEDGLNLEGRWEPVQGGTVRYFAELLRMTAFQLRPDLASPALLLNPRVREAIVHATDNDTAFQVITASKGLLSVAPMHPGDKFYAAAEKGTIHRAYDPRRARQLLEEAGLVQGSDGIYRTAAGEPFSVEWSYILQQANQRENEIFTAGLRDVGIQAVSRAFTAVDVRQPDVTKNYSGLSAVGSYGGKLDDYVTREVPSAENRYNGRNTSGWTTPEYERLVESFLTTLDAPERADRVTAMVRIWSTEVPTFPNYWTPIVNAWSSKLTGVVEKRHLDGPPPINSIHLWEWTS